MLNLYITGTAGSAKTATAVGLGLKFMEKGYKVGYFKPLGITTACDLEVDEDGLLMKNVLESDMDIESIVPLTISPYHLSRYSQLSEINKKIDLAYQKVSANTDIVIIDGSIFPYAMATAKLDTASLASKFNAAILYMIKPKNDFSLDEAVMHVRHFKCQNISVLGNIFYNVPRQILAKTEGIYKEILKENDLATLGIVPKRLELTSPTVEQYVQALGGEVLTGKDKLNRPVEESVVGAMTIESALSYLRRSPNKAVITGGDRIDIALAALETDTSVLILTGGLYPDVNVIAKASEKGVPVLLVHQDTYTTIEIMSKVSSRIRPDDKKGIAIAKENVEKYVDWQYILDSLT